MDRSSRLQLATVVAISMLCVSAVALMGLIYLYDEATTELECENQARLEFDALATELVVEMAAIGGSVSSVHGGCESADTPATTLGITYPDGMNADQATHELRGLGWVEHDGPRWPPNSMRSASGDLYLFVSRRGLRFGPKSSFVGD